MTGAAQAAADTRALYDRETHPCSSLVGLGS